MRLEGKYKKYNSIKNKEFIYDKGFYRAGSSNHNIGDFAIIVGSHTLKRVYCFNCNTIGRHSEYGESCPVCHTTANRLYNAPIIRVEKSIEGNKEILDIYKLIEVKGDEITLELGEQQFDRIEIDINTSEIFIYSNFADSIKTRNNRNVKTSILNYLNYSEIEELKSFENIKDNYEFLKDSLKDEHFWTYSYRSESSLKSKIVLDLLKLNKTNADFKEWIKYPKTLISLIKAENLNETNDFKLSNFKTPKDLQEFYKFKDNEIDYIFKVLENLGVYNGYTWDEYSILDTLSKTDSEIKKILYFYIEEGISTNYYYFFTKLLDFYQNNLFENNKPKYTKEQYDIIINELYKEIIRSKDNSFRHLEYRLLFLSQNNIELTFYSFNINNYQLLQFCKNSEKREQVFLQIAEKEDFVEAFEFLTKQDKDVLTKEEIEEYYI